MEITWDNVGYIVGGALAAYILVYLLVVVVLLCRGTKEVDWREARLAESNCPDREVPPAG